MNRKHINSFENFKLNEDKDFYKEMNLKYFANNDNFNFIKTELPDIFIKLIELSDPMLIKDIVDLLVKIINSKVYWEEEVTYSSRKNTYNKTHRYDKEWFINDLNKELDIYVNHDMDKGVYLWRRFTTNCFDGNKYNFIEKEY